MLDEMRFSSNSSCTLYVLVKMKDVKLKSLHTLACLNLNYGTKNRNQKWLQMVELIKSCVQYPCKFNLGHIFIVLLLSAGGKYFQKTLFGVNR